MERRLAAILLTDMVGYSRLMRLDEEGTIARQKAHREKVIDPRISMHGGRIVKTTGDGVLVEFPSVVDAVKCAVEVQKEMGGLETDVPEDRRIQYRIGINLGDIVIDGGDILGDGVNVAARLEGLANPGGVCISGAVYDQIRDKLDYGLEDLGEVEVKNIARPVRAFRVLQGGVAPDRSVQSTPKKRWYALAATIAVAAIAGGGLWSWQPWGERVDRVRPDKIAIPLPDKPSIAILAFANLSDDPQQEYFVDGFTEDLITNIAQSKGIFVIARNSSFTYKGRKVKIRQVAEELGVRYVLEGSVRRIGEKIRITAQLIDAMAGAHVWAKRYDKPAAELFDVQDDVTREIAGTLLSNIRSADLSRAARKQPANLSAYELVLRARAQWETPGKAAKQKARALAKRAITIDPTYAPAYAVIGDAFNSAYITQWEGPEALDRAYEAARKAVELDPLLSTAHEILGRVLLRRGQHHEAITAIEKSIRLNPNQSRHYGSLADALTFANRSEKAIGLLKIARRLDPFYPPRQNMYLGRAYYFARQFDKAVAELKNCAARTPKRRSCYMYLAPALAELGRMDDAKRAVATLLKLSPKFSISTSVKEHLPFVPSAKQFFVSGLRKAGVPDRPPLKRFDK